MLLSCDFYFYFIFNWEASNQFANWLVPFLLRQRKIKNIGCKENLKDSFLGKFLCGHNKKDFFHYSWVGGGWLEEISAGTFFL